MIIEMSTNFKRCTLLNETPPKKKKNKHKETVKNSDNITSVSQMS